ncbi:MAG: dipeptidase PepE [Vicinamibacteria bacterium]|jgi:dipeptidase E|nr:dipeptidase PepE [Vicinamibacteria bacterium]
MARRLVLISTSTVFGTRYLEHAYPELRDAFGSIARVLFIPHALQDRDAYAAKARPAFEEMGYGLDSLHEMSDPCEAIERAEAIFCGGGNTFRLLKALYEMGALPLIERRVKGGMVYAGASAGSNLACPTIRTTNDMPIVQPPSFDALGLVRFQINPHYLDPAPGSTHMGETRETRIREFHEENAAPVAGLREGAILRVEGPSIALKGVAGARVFRRGQEPLEFLTGAVLEEILEPADVIRPSS